MLLAIYEGIDYRLCCYRYITTSDNLFQGLYRYLIKCMYCISWCNSQLLLYLFSLSKKVSTTSITSLSGYLQYHCHTYIFFLQQSCQLQATNFVPWNSVGSFEQNMLCLSLFRNMARNVIFHINGKPCPYGCRIKLKCMITLNIQF